jgi:hypothetical protein
MAAPQLVELASQVRLITIESLAAAPEQGLLWAPPGTSNHILWHAGHALWAQDVLFIALITGQSELPPGWGETFGADCRPVQETNRIGTWPSRSAVEVHLREQLQRVIGLLGEIAEDRLSPDAPPTFDSWNLLFCCIHAWHDEAKHQGEMHLLRKQFRALHSPNIANS